MKGFVSIRLPQSGAERISGVAHILIRSLVDLVY